MSNALIKFQTRLSHLRDDRGATMVEYGLVVAAIAIVALVGAQLVGTNLLALFNTIAAAL